MPKKGSSVDKENSFKEEKNSHNIYNLLTKIHPIVLLKEY